MSLSRGEVGREANPHEESIGEQQEQPNGVFLGFIQQWEERVTRDCKRNNSGKCIILGV
jgi:hypothetical protein